MDPVGTPGPSGAPPHGAPSAPQSAPPGAPPGAPRSIAHRIAVSLWEMALITGVVVRVLHVVFNAHGHTLDWHAFVGSFILVPVVLLAFATAHLANYPVGQWVWRAPAFGALEATAESLMSLALIYAGRERWGTGRAEFGDWPAMVGTIFLTRMLMVLLFALVLGAVAQFVRRRELRAERRRVHEHQGEERRRR